MSEEPQQQKLPALLAGGRIAAIVPQSMEEAWRLATAIHRSGAAPRSYRTAEAIMIGILHGLEVGLTPFAALQSIAVINGTPAVWGDGLIALVESADALDQFDEAFTGEPYTDAWTARCTVKRRGRARVVVGEFSVADAKRAGLWDERETVKRRDGSMGPNDAPWRRYPKRMLQMRARAYALRDSCADILRGLRMREEVEDMQTFELPPPPPPPPPAGPAQLAAPGSTVVIVPMDADEKAVEWSEPDRSAADWSTDEGGQRAAPVPPPPPPPPGPARAFNATLFAEAVEEELGKMTADDPDVAATFAQVADMVRSKQPEMDVETFKRLERRLDEFEEMLSGDHGS